MSPEQPLAAFAYSDAFLGHDMPGHPENAGRLQAVLALLRRLDLLPQLAALPVEPAGEDDIALVHDRGYIAWLRQALSRPGAHDRPEHVPVCLFLRCRRHGYRRRDRLR